MPEHQANWWICDCIEMGRPGPACIYAGRTVCRLKEDPQGFFRCIKHGVILTPNADFDRLTREEVREKIN